MLLFVILFFVFILVLGFAMNYEIYFDSTDLNYKVRWKPLPFEEEEAQRMTKDLEARKAEAFTKALLRNRS